MPSGRVVIRSSWLASLLTFSPPGVAVVGVVAWRGPWTDALVPLAVLVAAIGLLRYFNHIVLTAEGLEIWWFRRQVVPWTHISSVEAMGSLGGHELKVFDAQENRSRRLPAPRGAFGVGAAEVAAAQALIEECWTAYRGGAPLPSAPPADR